MKERPEIIFVFRYENGTIKRVSHSLPMFVCQHDHVVPKGTKLHQIILKGAKPVDKANIAGKVGTGLTHTSIAVRVEKSLFSQSFILETPLADDVHIVFEVKNNERGEDITNNPIPRKRKVENSLEKVRVVVSKVRRRVYTEQYEDYTEFCIHFDHEE